jgi:hypothetical protein
MMRCVLRGIGHPWVVRFLRESVEKLRSPIPPRRPSHSIACDGSLLNCKEQFFHCMSHLVQHGCSHAFVGRHRCSHTLIHLVIQNDNVNSSKSVFRHENELVAAPRVADRATCTHKSMTLTDRLPCNYISNGTACILHRCSLAGIKAALFGRSAIIPLPPTAKKGRENERCTACWRRARSTGNWGASKDSRLRYVQAP